MRKRACDRSALLAYSLTRPEQRELILRAGISAAQPYLRHVYEISPFAKKVNRIGQQAFMTSQLGNNGWAVNTKDNVNSDGMSVSILNYRHTVTMQYYFDTWESWILYHNL